MLAPRRSGQGIGATASEERRVAMDVSEIVADSMPPTGAGDASADNRYAHLAQRAEAFVRHHGGVVQEDLLIAHVFGGAGSTGLWKPLLRNLLRAEDGLTLRGDGCWSVTDGLSAAGPLLDDFVVLDVETTGLRPTTQRIIEVAAIRYRNGTPAERLERLCNPAKRVPAYIAQLTGISDGLLADAEPFAAIADALIEFVDGAVVVGHNVDFDLRFVNAELKRLGRPGLINDRIDTMALAARLLPGLRRPSLDGVARQLGLVPRPGKLHRAGPDAELTAQVAARLADHARAAGYTAADLLNGSNATVGRTSESPVGRGRAVLDRSLLADIPKAPGVYLMRDAFDHIIYVGKAKNLRDRVGSYFSQPLGYTRKMDGLLESLVRVEVEVVGSELEALLLESQLIKRYQPRYNTALRAFEHYPYIRVDIGNPWPRITLAKARRDDGARYFGPFRNKTGARKTVDLLNRVLPLRTCTRSFKDARSYGSPCLELHLGRCLGPCVGKADRDDYAALVRDVVRFLDGRDEVLYERLWRALEEAAAKLDFERAAKLRQELLQVNAVVAVQRWLREAAEVHTLLLVLPSADPDAREILLVAGSRLWAQLRYRRDAGAEPLAARLGDAWRRLARRGVPRVDHDTVDETNILIRWLYQHSGHPAILPLPSPPNAPDWEALARRALALTDADLVFDDKASDAEEVDGWAGDEGAGLASTSPA